MHARQRSPFDSRGLLLLDQYAAAAAAAAVPTTTTATIGGLLRDKEAEETKETAAEETGDNCACTATNISKETDTEGERHTYRGKGDRKRQHMKANKCKINTGDRDTQRQETDNKRQDNRHRMQTQQQIKRPFN